MCLDDSYRTGIVRLIHLSVWGNKFIIIIGAKAGANETILIGLKLYFQGYLFILLKDAGLKLPSFRV